MQTRRYDNEPQLRKGSRLEAIKILYEDNHLLVVHKPKGVLSQADDSLRPDILNLMKDDLRRRYNKPGNIYLGLVHRLDVGVSGIMVLAKTSKAASRLSKEIRERRFEKRYLAVCEGSVEPTEGRLQDRLVKDHGKNVSYVQKGQAGSAERRSEKMSKERDASLDYRVLERRDNLSLVSIDLISGRSHQIRVQFASRGWPLVGDRRYDKRLAGQQGEEDIALIAYSLRFMHPTRDEMMYLHTDLPTGTPWDRVTPVDNS